MQLVDVPQHFAGQHDLVVDPGDDLAAIEIGSIGGTDRSCGRRSRCRRIFAEAAMRPLDIESCGTAPRSVVTHRSSATAISKNETVRRGQPLP